MYKFKSLKVFTGNEWINVFKDIPQEATEQIKNLIFADQAEVQMWIKDSAGWSHYMYTLKEVDE